MADDPPFDVEKPGGGLAQPALPAPLPDAACPVVPIEARRAARSLYWRGWAVVQIAQELGLAVSTVSSWRARHGWDQAPSITRCEDALEARYNTLVAKEKKTGGDFKEIDLLGRQLERVWRGRKYLGEGGTEADLNPRIAARNSPEVKAKKKAAKNLITHEEADKLEAAFVGGLFGYQLGWWRAADERTRFILKSRQIGATWYFAREALVRALRTGNNQIFISASRNQAGIFRQYIVDFVQEVLGRKLTGNPIVIQRGEDADGEPLAPVELHFLGTNYRTAQGYHGDVYVDEVFWIYGFDQLDKVASAMSTHSRYRRTYFSTPSVLTHEAYAKWSGEKFNRRRAKAERVRIAIDHAALRDGRLGPDRIWRQIVTLDDAIASGFDLADPDELRFEYSIDEFDLLFNCVFLDDALSMFPFELMRRCQVAAFDTWRDFEPFARRPFAGKVWVGYDPNGESGTGDDAALVVIAPPPSPGGAFRILEKQRLKGLQYGEQAARIRAVCERYDVAYLAIDGTGVGSAVYSLVSAWMPHAVKIGYSVESKTAMVLKAKSVISAGRLQYDEAWRDMTAAFLSIRPHITKQGVTYVAGRGGENGHADLAWAVMHCLINEPLDPAEGPPRSSMEIFG